MTLPFRKRLIVWTLFAASIPGINPGQAAERCLAEQLARAEQRIAERKIYDEARELGAKERQVQKEAEAKNKQKRLEWARKRLKNKEPLLPSEIRELKKTLNDLEEAGELESADAKLIKERLAPDKARAERLREEVARRQAKGDPMALDPSVHLSPRAQAELEEIKNDPARRKRAAASVKAINQIKKDPRYPALRTKKLSSSAAYGGIDTTTGDVFQSYAEAGTSGAYRVFWRYRSNGEVEILAVTPHP